LDCKVPYRLAVSLRRPLSFCGFHFCREGDAESLLAAKPTM
jgi:hypothetical protein